VLGQAGAAGLADGTLGDAVLVDARQDLVGVRQLLNQLDGVGVPVLAIITEGGWAAVTAGWGADDVILHTAGPGEVEARIRLAIARSSRPPAYRTEEVRSGELVIDEATYSARIRGAALDLTFKEFELLKFLAQHPRRVFTRSQLLQEVWGYDYFGGTRTVDVHVRRLRAKLGGENEALIGTVRNVGYKFVPARSDYRDQQPRASAGTRQATPDEAEEAAEEIVGGNKAAADKTAAGEPAGGEAAAVKTAAGEAVADKAAVGSHTAFAAGVTSQLGGGRQRAGGSSSSDDGLRR
jgi:DNA-binding response OmpR family regulator